MPNEKPITLDEVFAAETAKRNAAWTPEDEARLDAKRAEQRRLDEAYEKAHPTPTPDDGENDTDSEEESE